MTSFTQTQEWAVINAVANGMLRSWIGPPLLFRHRRWWRSWWEGHAVSLRDLVLDLPPGRLRITSDPLSPLEPVFNDRWTTVPWQTALVDLVGDDQALLRSFNRSARREVEAAPYTYECGGDEFIRLFLDLRPDKPLRLLTSKWWEIPEARCYRFFIAPGKGTLGVYSHEGLATEVMASGRCQDALHWQAFRSCRDAGDVLFDLAGFNPNPQTEKEKGIRAFKLKWSGRMVDTPILERSR